MPTDKTVIVAARRTPIGAFQGALSDVSAIDLAATSSRGAIEQAALAADRIDEVLTGCVLLAGLGQAPARQAALAAGVPSSVPCSTLNKVCGSGLKTVMLGDDLIRAGSANVVLAGGMESMSRAPYLLAGVRNGLRMGHNETLDHMFFDGLQSPYDGQMMGHFAERTAQKYGFTRADQDEFAIASVTRAVGAAANGKFVDEIAPVTVTSRKGPQEIRADETVTRANPNKIPTLRPAFAKDGTVTAASSSSIADGAASLLLMRDGEARADGVDVLATILGHTNFAQEPAWFTTSPVFAVQSLLAQLDLAVADIDLFEVNEAFACVTLAAMQDLGIPHERINVHGGACALGHPIGASGARILVTLIYALRQRGGGRGVASLCIGGGEAVAMAIEV